MYFEERKDVEVIQIGSSSWVDMVANQCKKKEVLFHGITDYKLDMASPFEKSTIRISIAVSGEPFDILKVQGQFVRDLSEFIKSYKPEIRA
jgi:hypothetical protein